MSTTLSRATAVVTGGAALTPTLSPEAFAARAAESNLPFILGMIIPFFVLAFVAVVLRTYVRTRIVKVMGIDDWVMLAALVRSTILRHVSQFGSIVLRFKSIAILLCVA